MWYYDSIADRARRRSLRPNPGLERQQALERELELARRQEIEPSPAPALEPSCQSHVVELAPRPPIHPGRRVDPRSTDRISRQQREHGVLHLLGQFRTASRRSLVDACFDEHPFAANGTLNSLKQRALVARARVPRGRTGYYVYYLTGAGRDLLASQRRNLDRNDSIAGPQRYWSGVGDLRQLRHDHHVFDAVTQDVADCLARGGRVVRVRLESELRGRLAAAEVMARRQFSDKARSAAAAREARRREAMQLGLRVFVRDVPLPDVLVELEERDGRRVVRAIEVASSHYSHAQLRQKFDAGFRVYGIPGFRSAGRRRRYAPLRDEEFPLSWGGR